MTDADDAELVARFLKREATSKQTLELKAQEKEKGHDWVVPCDVIACTEIIAVCREIEQLRREVAEATKFVKFVSSHANYIGSGRYEVRFTDVWHRAASAFAAKHGGRE